MAVGAPVLALAAFLDRNWVLSELPLRNRAPALGRAVLVEGWPC